MSKNIDDSIKFAWAYLLKYGKLTNGRWDYYGGHYQDADNKDKYNWEAKSTKMQELTEKAITVGIDWDKTSIPTVSEEGHFTDTFDSVGGRSLGTLGTLVLKNGEKFLIGSSDDDAAHLAEAARELMCGKKSEVVNLAEKL